MKTIVFNKLLNIIYEEFKNYKSIFGIPSAALFKKEKNQCYNIFNHNIDVPIGVAAGPNTQLSQNIISSYLVGARFIELKTVQIMDSLEINKPCIDVRDEGYNAEWSTELSLNDAFDEYVKAWIVLHLFDLILPLHQQNFPSFAFNMSIGYTFEGIKSKKMQVFIDNMLGTSKNNTFNKYIDEVINFIKKNDLKIFNRNLDKAFICDEIKQINRRLVHSVTLSTMHGTKPEEIEIIARHLIKEKKINTYVKLNPTLLGFDNVQSILDNLGYEYIQLDRENFNNDISIEMAIQLIKNLKKTALDSNVHFGVKLTNTLACINKDNYLSDKYIYLSGKPLFPIAIQVANNLANVFNGDLNISFSGGVDLYNVIPLYEAGIYPITVATLLLKPSGYLKFKNLANALERVYSGGDKNNIDLKKLNILAKKALNDSYYKKKKAAFKRHKIRNNLKLFDCFVAPCSKKCPFEQDVPVYIYNIEQKDYDKALEIIYLKNPLPAITGSICDHKCMFHCNRIDLDGTLNIRGLKYCAVESGRFKPTKITDTFKNINAAIIGAGPAGLSAAYYLSLYGFNVSLFEKSDMLGGVVKQILPSFRLKESDINRDIDNILSLGVNVRLNVDVEKLLIEKLKREGFKYIIYAIGAGVAKELILKNAKPGKVINALEFLKAYKHRELKNIGREIVVVGGGNTAVDSARAAVRVEGVKRVSVLYRRSFYEMPADLEEYENAVKEGISYIFLAQPIEFVGNKTIRCQKMMLSEKGEDGRRLSIPSDETFDVEADLLITAIGETVDTKFLEKCGVPLDEANNINVDEAYETKIKDVYLIGDSALGPSTIADSIATAKQACVSILEKEGISFADHINKIMLKENKKISEYFNKNNNIQCLVERKINIENVHNGELSFFGGKEAQRCMQCSLECLRCVDVCPNRANIAIDVSHLNRFDNKIQVLHIDDYCNECGNCATFCPYDGRPYRDKFTYFSEKERLLTSANNGFCVTDLAKKQVLIKINDNIYNNLLENIMELEKDDNLLINSTYLISTIFECYRYIL